MANLRQVSACQPNFKKCVYLIPKMYIRNSRKQHYQYQTGTYLYIIEYHNLKIRTLSTWKKCPYSAARKTLQLKIKSKKKASH